MNWFPPRPVSGSPLGPVQAVDYGNGVAVAVGIMGIYSSSNLVDWAHASGIQGYDLSDVTYHDGVFWAVGANDGDELTPPIL
jgi:hypothetical protein